MRAAFYKGTRPGLPGVYNRLVRAVDRGPYSHCELVFDDGISFSSSWMDGGVRAKRISFETARWDSIELSGVVFDADAARRWFDAHVGAPYDLRGNFRFLVGLVADAPGGFFCSEALGAALGIAEPWRLGPNGLAVMLKEIQRLRDCCNFVAMAAT